MPIKDPEKAREYNRNYQRARRAGMPGNAAADFPSSFRIETAEDVRNLLELTINEVRDADADPLVKARVVGSLAGLTLKAIESSHMEARLIDVEEMLKKGGKQS